MSGSKIEDEIRISSKVTKIAPVREDQVNITEGQAQLIAEFVDSPVYKMLKKNIVPQRKDQIARRSLSEAQDYEQVLFYRGQVFELTHFFKLLKVLRDEFIKQTTDKKDRQFKK